MSLGVWFYQRLRTQHDTPLLIRKDFLFDRPKRCGRPLIFIDAILPISDTLFDSSQAQKAAKSIRSIQRSFADRVSTANFCPCATGGPNSSGMPRLRRV